MKRPLVAWIAVLAGSLICVATQAGTGPNFVIIVTDDQRYDTLWAMPSVQARLVQPGLTFTKAYATAPWCCPSRAGFISGGYYPHNTMVQTNGRVLRFNFNDSLGLRMQQAGYTTAAIGKFFNDYGPALAPEVPPGWDYFNIISSVQFGIDWNDYEVLIGSSGGTSTTGKVQGSQQYITDYQSDRALDFLDTVGTDPFLLYLGTNAVHQPATPAPQDLGSFSDYTYSSPGTEETDLSDKGSWVLEHPFTCPTEAELRIQRELESLQSVDRAVDAIIDRLEQLELLDNTYVLFTSDHGNMWGEHSLCFKGKVYEEGVRVPFVVTGPGVQGGSNDELVAVNLDIGATLYDIAGISAPLDGISLVPLFGGAAPPWRESLVFQSYREPIVSAIRVSRSDGEWKLIEWGNGDVEFYDLLADPNELESAHSNPQYAALMSEFAQTLETDRGLSITTDELPPAVVNQPYSFTFSRYGGVGPFIWWQIGGPLPSGLTFDGATAELAGVPTQSGCFNRGFVVAGTRMATHAQVIESTYFFYDLCVSADADGDGIGDEFDNCSAVANPGQRDTNGDGYGNICDPDLSDNGIVNPEDLSIFASRFFTDDPDADFNGDGVVNPLDLGILKYYFFGPPGPSGLVP